MSLINLFAAAGAAFARWRQRQRAYAELMALDDRSLADIGIRRSEIQAVVYGAHGASRGGPARDTAFDGAAKHAWLAAGHR